MNGFIIGLVMLIGSHPLSDAISEQAGIMAAESIRWDCDSDQECYVVCVAQGADETLCSAWSYNSSGFAHQRET